MTSVYTPSILNDVPDLEYLYADYIMKKHAHDKFAYVLAYVTTEKGKQEEIDMYIPLSITHCEWMYNEDVKEATESITRKKERMDQALAKWEGESKFQAQHAFVKSISSSSSLFGYYEVIRTPTHYEFIFKRAFHVIDIDHIGKITKLPLQVIMGLGDFEDVTPDKVRISSKN